MVYSNRFVMSVLVDGKPQKELANGVVPIQFGREYALRFRNKNDRRAVVKFTIDGENVSGNGYIIPANDAIDIRRHWSKDATFRFVDLDSPEAVDFGKNGPNHDGSKGVIEAKFYLERPYTPVKVPQNVYHHHHYYERQKTWGNSGDTWPTLNNPYVPPATFCSTNPPASPIELPKSINLDASNIPKEIKCTVPPMAFNQPPTIMPCCFGPAPTPLKEGCTVEGRASGQTFTSEYIDLETDFVLVRCQLKGQTDLPVHTPANETYCTNCGAKRARPADNFCGVCGRKF